MDAAARIKALEDLYAELPKVACQQRCSYACVNPDMTPLERERIREATGHTIVPIRDKTVARQNCRALGVLGTCTAYDLRPAVCRLWGVVRFLQCRHGCTPEGGFMPDVDAQVWLVKVGVVGGMTPEAEGDRMIRYLRGPYGERICERAMRKTRFTELLAWRRHNGINDNNVTEILKILGEESEALEVRHREAGGQ